MFFVVIQLVIYQIIFLILLQWAIEVWGECRCSLGTMIGVALI